MKISKRSSSALIAPLAAAGALLKSGTLPKNPWRTVLLMAASLCLTAGARADSEAYTFLGAYSSAEDQSGTLYNYRDERVNTDPHFQVYDQQTRPDVYKVVTANFGYLSAKMTNTNGVFPNNIHSGTGRLLAKWSDMVTISHSTLNGTPGVFRARFSVYGYLSAEQTGEDGASIGVNANFNQYALPQVTVSASPSNSSQSATIHASAADFTGGPNYVDIPFVFGTPFSLNAQLFLGNPGTAGFGTAKVDGSVTMQFDGAGVYDQDLNLVPSYVANSDSGINWVVSQGPSPITFDSVQVDKPDAVTGLVPLTLQGLAGTSAILQTSTDLTGWTDVQTVDFTTVPAHLSHPGIPGEPNRFFHLRLP